jgi:hypothetical protein
LDYRLSSTVATYSLLSEGIIEIWSHMQIHF